MRKVFLIIGSSIMFLAVSCSNKIDSNEMFINNSDYYIGKSVSQLIAGAKFSLQDLRVSELDRKGYFNNLTLCYSNGINLKLTLDSSHYLNKRNTCRHWDFNKIIKGKINKIELLEHGINKNDSIEVKVLFFSVDSLFVDRIMIMDNGHRLSMDSLYRADCLKIE